MMRLLEEFLTLEEGTDKLSETSVENYHSTLRKIREKGISHLNRGGSLKSRIHEISKCKQASNKSEHLL
jgi:ribosomal protein S20